MIVSLLHQEQNRGNCTSRVSGSTLVFVGFPHTGQQTNPLSLICTLFPPSYRWRNRQDSNLHYPLQVERISNPPQYLLCLLFRMWQAERNNQETPLPRFFTYKKVFGGRWRTRTPKRPSLTSTSVFWTAVLPLHQSSIFCCRFSRRGFRGQWYQHIRLGPSEVTNR